MSDPTIAILAGILALSVLFAIVQVLLWQHSRMEHDVLSADNAFLHARIDELMQTIAELDERQAADEQHCDGWHDLFSDDRSSVQALLDRVTQLEDAVTAPPAVAPLTLGAGPILIDSEVPEEPALFYQLGDMPALTEPTGYVPILPVTGRAAPVDNTETNFTRAKVAEVLARLDQVEVVDARELAEVTS